MSAVSYRMDGLRELKQRLENVKREFQDRPIKAGLRAAGKVLKKAIVDAAPYDGKTPDGVHIKDNVQVGRSRSQSGPGVEVFTVGIKYGRKTLASGKSVKTEGDAFYWKFLEFGSSNVPKQAFIRPAFEASQQAQLKAFEKAMATAIRRLERQAQRAQP